MDQQERCVLGSHCMSCCEVWYCAAGSTDQEMCHGADVWGANSWGSRWIATCAAIEVTIVASDNQERPRNICPFLGSFLLVLLNMLLATDRLCCHSLLMSWCCHDLEYLFPVPFRRWKSTELYDNLLLFSGGLVQPAAGFAVQFILSDSQASCKTHSLTTGR